jgi:glycine/D-amino acid oxidase-like deaminating enzyme
MNATVRADSGATWYAARATGPFERPRLTYDLDVDVCVIGGGLAGLTTAREIARRGWTVAVVEARRVAWNASGRNCGFVVPGFGADVRGMVERIGLERAKALWALSEAGLEYVRTTIRDTEMPGVDPVAGWLDVSKIDNGDELLTIASLLQDFGAEIEGWPTERVRAALKSDFYFHAIHYPTAFHIDPLNYAHGLANAALAAGAMIFEETPALAIDPAGVRKHVITPKGRLRAPHVVLAGNAYLGGLAPSLADTVMPVTGYVAVTAPLGERLGEAIAYNGAVSDTRLSDFHYRIVDGDRLMWAGGAGVWPPSPQRAAKRFKAAIARIFPQLGPVEFEHTWGGVMGFSVHRVPQVGEVVPGLWLASAFGAHGLNTTAMAGELIAAAITERDDRWRLFLPYELVWAGGMLGRAVRHAAAWSRRAGEEFAGSLARRREAVRQAEARPGVVPGRARPAAAASAPHQVESKAVPAKPRIADTPVADASVLVPEVESLLRQAARSAEVGRAGHADAQMQHRPEKSLAKPTRSLGQDTEKPTFSDKSGLGE